MNFASIFADAPLQHVRNPKRSTDLVHVLVAAISHYASATDDLQVGHLCQPRQNVILNTVGEDRVFLVVTETLKWQHRDAGGWRRMNQFAPPQDNADRAREGNRAKNQSCDRRIPTDPLVTMDKSASWPRADRLMSKPVLEIFGQSHRCLVTA